MVNLNLPKLHAPSFPKRSSLGSWTVAPRRSSVAYLQDQSRGVSEDGTEKHQRQYDDGPVPRVTIHSFIMGVFVSMGGFVFGYDTGMVPAIEPQNRENQ
jgi:hypothetical protein